MTADAPITEQLAVTAAGAAASDLAVASAYRPRSRAQLAEEAAATAGGLVALLGPAPRRVGVFAGDGADQLAALLAVLTAGHVALVLEPTAPDDLLQALQEAAGLALVVADRASASRAWSVFGYGASVALPRLTRYTGRAPRAVAPDDPAVLTATVTAPTDVSVVERSHAELSAGATGWVASTALTPNDRVSTLVRRSSTFGLDATLGTLAAGAVVVPGDPAAPPDQVVRQWQDAGVSVVATTALWQARLAGQLPPHVRVRTPAPPDPSHPPSPTPPDRAAPAPPATEARTPERRAGSAADDATGVLIRLFGEVLGREDVSADDDFFDLGGYSLLAARVLVLFEERTGVRLPMSTFLDGASPRSLATSAASALEGPAVCVQAGSADRPTLFLTHDLQGSTWGFRHLAAALGEDQPVVGFESPLLAGVHDPATIGALADCYVEVLRARQLSGPYLLCGYSFGGILAFEMARRLRAVGEDVPVLAVIDVGPGYRGLAYSRRRLPPLPYRQDLERAPGRLPAWARPLRRLWCNEWVLPAWWRRQLRRDGRVRADQRLWFAWWAHWSMVGPDWSPEAYDGPVDVLWATRTASTDASLGWGDVADDVRVHRVGRHHETLLEPPEVDEVGAVVRRLIDAQIGRRD